jgi:hypothetical protein
MKMRRGIDPRFLDLSTSWRQVVSFKLRPLYVWIKRPSTHWTGSWDPRVSLDDVKKKKFLTLQELEL